MNPTRGIQYAASDNPGGGRGLNPMGGVSAITNPLPTPALEKNGTGPDLNGANELNAGDFSTTPLMDQYQTQSIPDWSQS